VRSGTSPGTSGNKSSLGAGRKKELEQPASRVPWAAFELQSHMAVLGLKLPACSADGPSCGEKHHN